MSRLSRAVAISLALHFLVVVSFAMVRVGGKEDRFPDAQFVDLVWPLPPPGTGAPSPSADPARLPASAPAPAPAPPAPEARAAAPAPPDAAPPPAETPPAAEAVPSPPAAEVRDAPPDAPPAEATAAPAEASPPPPAPSAPPPSATASAAAPPESADEHAGQGGLCPKCYLAKEGPPLVGHLLEQMFPREVLATVPWGRGRVLLTWTPDGRVFWDADSRSARLSEALAQVRWSYFPHPSQFGLPNHSVLLDVELQGGRFRVLSVVPA